MKSRKSARKRAAAPLAKPETTDDYLAAVEPDKRAVLEKLRQMIRRAAPKAEECVSYGIPAFRLNGKLLVAYAAAKKHCAFYPGSVVKACAKELKDYDTSGNGTIRFPADEPLPASLVRKLVRLRMDKVATVAAAILLGLAFNAIAAPSATPEPSRTVAQTTLRSGHGVFVAHLDTVTGAIRSVTVLTSTGDDKIDAVVVRTLGAGRFKPGTAALVRIPVFFQEQPSGELKFSY